jgi:hypothetical protein
MEFEPCPTATHSPVPGTTTAAPAFFGKKLPTVLIILIDICRISVAIICFKETHRKIES